MIYDNLENIGRYRGISIWFEKAVEFLENTDLTALPIGRIEIVQGKVFATIMEAEAKEETEVLFEIHKKFMDIQIDIEGTEKIQIGLDKKISEDYKEETDFGTVSSIKTAECMMGKGKFIVCMKEEAHRPGIIAQEERHLKKCVIKVFAE